MEKYLPYIVSIITALLSFFGAILVNRKNNKAEIEKLKLEHQQTLERNKQEQDAKIAYLEKEIGMKMGAQIVEDFTKKTTEAIFSAPAVSHAINESAKKSFLNNKKNKRKNG